MEVLEVNKEYPELIKVRAVAQDSCVSIKDAKSSEKVDERDVREGWLSCQEVTRGVHDGLQRFRSRLRRTSRESKEIPSRAPITAASASKAGSPPADPTVGVQDTEEMATDLAKWLKDALQKSNIRLMEFFIDMDVEQKGHVTKEGFLKSLSDLTPLSERQLTQIYKLWTADTAGTLDYHRLEVA